MQQAFFPNRWAFGLAKLYNNIVVRVQMAYQVVLGSIGYITPINCINKLGTILCSCTPFRAIGGWATTSKTNKTKKKKKKKKKNLM